MSTRYDVVIIGAGAAGLMCAIECGKRGRKTLIVEHCNKAGKKILISGGGRCNFTNIQASPAQYTSTNKHFCKSALSRYTAQDFIDLVNQHNISYHEKKLGQLFCDESARQVVEMLLEECNKTKVEIWTQSSVEKVVNEDCFELTTTQGPLKADSLVIASGGLSIPKMGATSFGYKIAEQFGHELAETKPALVPFTFNPQQLENFEGLSGISIDAEVSCKNISFRENILITHRGVSGPAILQISSFWEQGQAITINLLPDYDLLALLEDETNAGREVKGVLFDYLPKRFVQRIFDVWLENKPIRQLTPAEKEEIVRFIHSWTITPNGTEGYRTAEVTLGGVSVDKISSKTFESALTPNLYFVGEVLDVTGWLGGYNFQWAWASGYCAGQFA